MAYDPHNEWPMGSYKHSWKLFRKMSNETQATAEHLLACPLWPKIHKFVMVDLGCGDGLLIDAVAIKSPKEVSEVRLVDPDIAFLREAKKNIEQTGVVERIESHRRSAEDNPTRFYDGAHVILAVHLVYLMKQGALNTVLARLPVGIPMYVVLDAPDSIFSTLWKKTAPKYWARSVEVHRIMGSLPSSEFRVIRSTIKSRIDSPLAHTQNNVRDSVLGIMCYSELANMGTKEKAWVAQQVTQHLVGGHITCASTCYEIVKLRAKEGR